jgi:hypothetical protein
MRNTIVLLAALLSLPLPLAASGTQEPSKARTTYADKTFTLYALAEKGGEAEIFSIERMTIPSGVALSTWTAFKLQDGELATEGSAAFSLRSSAVRSTNRADGLLVLEYRITAAFQDAAQANPRSSQEVSFTVKDCMNNKGELLYQPARLAVIRAVGLSKLSSGTFRLAELSYDAGRFTARVEFK